MAKNSPDQFFQQGSQIKFKLASDSKGLPNIQKHLKETPGGCIKRKKSGSNQDHALERELRFLKLLWLPRACYFRCPPSTSTAGLAVSSLMGELIVDLLVLRNEAEGSCWGDCALSRSWSWGEEKCSLSGNSSGMERKACQVPETFVPEDMLPPGQTGDDEGWAGEKEVTERLNR